METTNYLLTDKVQITDGTGLNFILFLGKKEPEAICENDYDELPTWKELTDDLIEFCKEEGICLSYLGEQGTIQQGNSRSKFAPCAIEYIAKNIVN